MSDLIYLFNCWWKTVIRGNPNKRSFLIFSKMLRLEIECLLYTGRFTSEI
jgi:hypothetical protein